jgi:hypothetical protein
MIRTHKPSGHHWTCASHFQQSKQYRNLDAQDWQAPSAKILVADPDDDLPISLRVAKRRRVEQMANDFLEGQPLFISSACANGPDLTATVDKVLCDKRMTWNELLDDYDEDLWADGEDGWAALRKRSKARALQKQSRSRSKDSRRSTRSAVDAISRNAEAIPPQDICPTPKPRQKISTAPSEEALTMAAKLRARKASLLANPDGRPDLLLPLTAQVTQSAPPTARAPSTFKECSSSRPFNPNTPAETTMADELRLSRTESPSHRPRAFTMPVESFSSETTVEDTTTQLGEGEPTATGSTAMELCTAEQNIGSSMDTAPPVNFGYVARTSLPPNAGRAHPTWTPINDRHSQAFLTSTSASAKTPPTRSAKAKTPKENTSARQQKTSKTPTSFGESSQVLSQTRLTSSFKAAKSEYIAVEKSQNGTTPFVYRKKAKASKDVDSRTAPNSAEKNTPQRIPQSAENDRVTPKPSGSTALPSVSAAPPTINLSFMQDSSFAPALSMALVDEHLNRKLPNSPGSARRSSSVKKALRSEMRLSGADLSRVPGEPSSSQSHEPLEPPSAPQDADAQTLSETYRKSRSDRRSTGQWPGTQILLSRAQHDLFMSPEKLALAQAISPSEILPDHGDSSNVQQLDDSCAPLQQVLQERLPGTQALMDNWSPWSTVKKPKPGKRASFAPSPLVDKNTISPINGAERSLRSGVKQSSLPHKMQGNKQRRSSLRFATSTTETPVPHRKAVAESHTPVNTSHSTEASIHSPSVTCPFSQSVYELAQADTTSPGINFDFTTMSFAATAEQPAVDVDGSMADWASHDRISALQNGQLSSEDPPPETVLADVATEFLSTADIDGVLGRV